MAYGVKYRFDLESIHGVLYTVMILKNNYSGTIKTRPLGKSPVIRMQEGDPFRATSCNLVLECQEDTNGVGEFAELYTSDPNEFRVDIYRGGTINVGGTMIWQGFVATELYSEPDIAPPYDVSVTATDGLGLLKEYDFPARGLQSVRSHLRYLLSQTGLNLNLYCCLTQGPTNGSPTDLFDNISINLDYMVGENCYDVMSELLRSLHLTVTQYKGAWLLIRETDTADKLNSSGALSVYSLPSRSQQSITTTTISGVSKSVGKMGVADMWPVGYLTRRVVPAKKSVTIEAPWHPVNGAPSVQEDDWDTSGYVYTGATFVSVGDGNSYYQFGTSGGYNFTDVVFAEIPVANFTKTIDVRILASLASGLTSGGVIGMHAQFFPSGGSSFISYCGPEQGWGTYATSDSSIPKQTVDVQTDLASDAQEVAIALPPPSGYGAGTLKIFIVGKGIRVFDVSVAQNMNKGYRDRILINNGARGEDGTYVITGGRVLYGDLIAGAFHNGVFVFTSNPDNPVTAWSDNRRYGLDFMSLTAMDYAQSIALPRIELTGKIDVPSYLTTIPFVLSLRNVYHQMKNYDWDLFEEEVNFSAVSTPAASLTVESETITNL